MNVAVDARKSCLLAGFAFAMAISTGSGAFAQNCTTTIAGPGAPFFGGQLTAAAAAGGASSGAFAGALGNMSTAASKAAPSFQHRATPSLISPAAVSGFVALAAKSPTSSAQIRPAP